MAAASASVLPPAPAHRSTTCSPGLRVGQQGRELRAFVLDFDQALQERRLGVDRRVLGLRAELDAQAERRPARRLGRKMGERGLRLLALGLERVDPQVERRAGGERRAFLRALLAEHAGEMRIEPLRIVAGDMGRRTIECRRREPRPLGLREQRRCEARAIGKPRDRVEVEPAFELEHAEEDRARRLLAHEERRRRAPAQRVVDEARDRGAVAGAGEAVGKAPVLERVGGRPMARLDIGEDFDRRGDARSWRHGSPSRMRTAKTAHMIASTIAPARNSRPRRGTWLSVTCTSACSTRSTTNTQASSTNRRSA